MNKTRQKSCAAGVLAACAYFGSGEKVAQATSNCLPPGSTGSTVAVLNNSYVIANNDTSSKPYLMRCIDWESDGSWSVTSSAPSQYTFPHIMQGQHYGEGPTAGSNMPLQVSAIKRWPITWQINGTAGVTGGYNPIVEFWATTYNPNDQTACNNAAASQCSGSPGKVQQADGTELMIWLGSTQGSPAGLAPLGPLVTIGGIVWEVYVTGKWQPQGAPIPWNYIAYVPLHWNSGVMLNNLSMDFKPFFDDAKTRGAGSSNAAAPCQNGAQGNGQCIYDGWYVTSVQAGFEITGNDNGLTSSFFRSALNSTIGSCTTTQGVSSPCTMAGGLAGVCVGGQCVLPAGANCTLDADCGGAAGSCFNNVCLGTVEDPQNVTCGTSGGAEVVCSRQNGCTYSTQRGGISVACGTSSAPGAITCDGPNDCPANSECCVGPGNFQSCVVQAHPGVVGSGCATVDPSQFGPQATVVCDPKNPINTCPTGTACGGYGLSGFACLADAPLVFWPNSNGIDVPGPASLDWSGGETLGECPAAQPVIGLSQFPDESHSESLLCQPYPIPTYSKIESSCRTLMFSVGTSSWTNNPNPWPFGADYPDWDPGYVKAQCAPNEFVAGVSQSNNGFADGPDGILCCTGAVTASSCNTEYFYGQNSSSYSGLDWASGYYKGQCAPGKYVQGVSAVPVSSSSQVLAAAHALRCCGP
jgi:hypothetical protein